MPTKVVSFCSMPYRLLPLTGPALLAGLWALVTHLHLLSPLFLPTPESVAGALWRDTVNGTLLAHLVATTARVGAGCSLGILIGALLGLVLGRIPILHASSELLIDLFRSIPIACLFPLFLVFFGIGNTSKVATAVWSSTFVVLLGTVYGVRGANRTRLMLAKTMGATELQVFFYVLIPEALPMIVTSIRVAVSLGLVVVLVTEMFMGTNTGLGRYVYDASMIYRTEEMYAGILVTGLLGYSLNRLFVLLEERMVHWRGK